MNTPKKSTRRSSILPKELRNFTTKFSLPTFVKRLHKLTDNQRNAVTRVGFGSLLRLSNKILRRNLLVELMDRWCCKKQAFVLLPGEIKITLKDVALILGLRVIGEPVILKEDTPFINLESEYGAALWNRKITVASIEERLDSLGEVDNEDFIRSFLLYTFGIFLFPSANGKVDSRYLYFLNDLDKVNSFAWGAAVLEDIVYWLTKRKEANAQCLGGCLIFLQVWSYEHIDLARPLLTVFTFPRVCRWGNIKSSLREGFSLKFQELNKKQVVWELKITSEESRIDIIQEISRQAQRVEINIPDSPFPNVSLHIGNHISSRYESEHRAVERGRELDMELVDETCENILEKLRTSRSASMISIDSTESRETSHPGEKKEQEKSPCVAKITSTIILSSDEEDVFRTTDHVREDSNSVPKKEIADLLNEIEYLKKQLLGCSNVHEQNVKLCKEVEDLRRENLHLRAANSAAKRFEDRLERLVLDDAADTGEQTTGIA
ncbi:Aminotransferase-like mobile domain containing protein [Heracleum sosnowskyi]|uniref:Aminotransferase-like mobile domain containing protein n=1 Tax=Heracleum sosnowskyi TaxID=360622 RepID=A0AAD8N830_9APIA|nr:Aminotransferase-like mobile domain containing protein [Heracleum sosnowskyi]